MKKYSLIFFLLVSSVLGKEPEYDGAYIATKNGKYVDLPSFESGQNVTGYFSHICLEQRDKTYPKIKKSSIKNFLVKGDNAKYISFHYLRARNKSFGRYFLCFDKKREIPFRKKSSSSKVIADTKNFDTGVIIAWAGNDFWAFEVE